MKRRILSFFLVICMMVSLMPPMSLFSSAAGSGTPADPYTDQSDLEWAVGHVPADDDPLTILNTLYPAPINGQEETIEYKRACSEFINPYKIYETQVLFYTDEAATISYDPSVHTGVSTVYVTAFQLAYTYYSQSYELIKRAYTYNGTDWVGSSAYAVTPHTEYAKLMMSPVTQIMSGPVRVEETYGTETVYLDPTTGIAKHTLDIAGDTVTGTYMLRWEPGTLDALRKVSADLTASGYKNDAMYYALPSATPWGMSSSASYGEYQFAKTIEYLQEETIKGTSHEYDYEVYYGNDPSAFTKIDATSTFAEGDVLNLWIKVNNFTYTEIEQEYDLLGGVFYEDTSVDPFTSDWPASYSARSLKFTTQHSAESITAEYLSAKTIETSGNVRVTLPDGTMAVATIYADGYANVQWTVPSSLTNKGTAPVNADLKVQYIGAAESYTETLNFVTKSIADATTSNIYVVSGDFKVNGTATLGVKDIVDAQGTPVADIEYTVDWYQKTSDTVADWTYIGTGLTVDVTPASTAYKYRAVVKPVGTIYEFGADEIIFATAPALAEVALGAFTADKATAVIGEVVTATVTVTPAITGGTVTLFEDGVIVGSADLTAGTAVISYVPTSAGNKALTVKYSGIEGIYAPADFTATTVALTVTDNQLDNLAVWNIIADNDPTFDVADLVPGTTYLIGVTNDHGYVYGTDYVVTWKMSVDGGLTWTDMFDGAALENISVTPQSIDYRYMAVVTPMGVYVSSTGDSFKLQCGCSSTKAVSGISLYVDNEYPYENEKITLTAIVGSYASAPLAGGVVTFYGPDGDIIGQATVDDAGRASLTVDAPAYTGAAVEYEAYYSGNASVADSNSAPIDVFSMSVTIATDTLNIKVDTTDIKQDVTSVLSIPAVKSLDDEALVYGTHYIVKWYVDYGDGEFVEVFGTDTLTVTPETPYERYQAVIVPVTGLGSNYTAPANGIVLNPTIALGDAGLYATQIDLTYVKEADATASLYNEDIITLNAKVTTDGATPVIGGFVTFTDDANGVVLGTAEIGVGGVATLKGIVVNGDLDITASYSGTDKYAASTVNMTETVKSAEITVNTTAITVYDETSVDVTGTLLDVLTNYTLEAPEVYSTDGDLLAAGTDYLVSWYKYNDGAWETMIDKGTQTSITVNAEDTSVRYKATIYPMGEYSAPVNGIALDEIAFDGKAATTTTISLNVASAYEGDEVILTAEVADKLGSVYYGDVQFYSVQDSVTEYLGLVTLNASGVAEIRVEVPVYSETDPTIEYYAVYLENDIYLSSTSATVELEQLSTAIKWESSSDIIIYEGEDTTGTVVTDMDAGKTYTLAIPEVVSLDEKTALTAGTDYIVYWYVNETENGTSDDWKLVAETANNGTTIRIDPDKVNYSYKALVYPADAVSESDFTVFDKAWDGASYVQYLETGSTNKTLLVPTETTLVLSETTEYEGETITLTATVVDTNASEQINTGKVAFYLDGEYLATVAIGLDGTATLDVAVPEWVTANGTVEYTAEYLANEVYNTSSDAETLTVWSTSIAWDASSDIIIYEGEDTTGTVVTEMIAGQTYTLAIPEVVSLDGNTVLTAGIDYIVYWYVNETENGTSADWKLVAETANNGTTIRIDPDKINYSYKALVYAADAVNESDFTLFDKAWDGVEYVPYLTSEITNKTELMSTVTYVEIEPLKNDDISEAGTTTSYGSVIDATDHLAQYEGQYINIEITVVDANGENVTEGYVDVLDANGNYLTWAPIELVDGYAEIAVQMTEYDETLSAAENLEEFRVEYYADNIYDISSESASIYIKSTAIDVPTITSSLPNLLGDDSTTKTEVLDNLPAGKEITFTLDKPVYATDGRELTEGVDFEMIWQKASMAFNNYAFADQIGEDKNAYTVSSGIVGNSFRISLLPVGDMTVGTYSMQANIGEKDTPVVTVDPVVIFDTDTKTFDTTVATDLTDGAHEGDEVTINVTVVAPVDATERPTGFVKLTYENEDSTTGEIGIYPIAAPTNLDADSLTATVTVKTTDLPEGTLTIKAEYLGDETYNATSDTKTYRMWSVDLAPVTIVANPDHATLIADEEYTITLQDVYTDHGELLTLDQYTVTWQYSDNSGYTWNELTDETDRTVITQTPATEYYAYRAIVTTTTKLYNQDNVNLEDTAISNVIGSKRNETFLEVTASAPTVYQSNEITLYATSQDPITGYVQFYWTDYREDGDYSASTFTPVVSTDADGGNTFELMPVSGSELAKVATLVTIELPVSDDGTLRDVVFFVEYLGDKTYEPATNMDAASDLASDVVRVYSSVVYNPSVEITVNGDRLIADLADTIIELGTVTTLDWEEPIDPSIYTLSHELDYVIEWQYCEKYGADQENWQTIPDSTNNMNIILTPEEGYAYRVKLTVRDDSAKVKESYYTDQVYYSNVLVVENAAADLNVELSPKSSAAYDGDDVTLYISLFGGETTPDGEVTVTIKDENGDVVKTFSNNTVNGMVEFLWEEVPAGTYTVETTATPNNGYEGFGASTYTDTQTYIVLYREPGVEVQTKTVTYNGQVQNFTADDITFTTLPADLADLAKSEVVFLCYDAEGKLVEARDAGEYTVIVYLPQSAYWEESKTEATLVIERREISVTDIEVQNKIYDGNTDVNVLAVTLEDAETAQASTGLPTNETGVIHGDSVYAIGTAAAASANAGDTTVTFTLTKLEGPDAGNYTLVGTYSEDISIERSQLKGEIAPVTLVYADEALDFDREDVYLIDQAGDEYEDFTLAYYYHDGTGIKLVDEIYKVGKYTVIASGDDNYKGGATGVLYVTDAEDAEEAHGTIDESKYASSLIDITNTQQTYGQVVGASATATNATISKIEYLVDGAYTTTAPQNVGRYIMRATASTGDTAYGVFTVYKAAAEVSIPSVAGKIYDNTPVSVANAASFPAGTYFTYVGGQLTEVSYEAPEDAGTYTVTAHIPASANTAVTEYSSTFTIDKRIVTVSVENTYAEMYNTNAVWDLTFENIAAGDSNLDFIAQPQVDYDYDPHAIGTYNIYPFGAIADNYNFEYVETVLSVIAHDPQEPLEIYGEPTGNIYYGDEFTLTLYGNTGNYVSHSGYNTNNSSDIYWSLEKDAAFIGDVTIDALGNVDVDGVGTFTVTAVRGNGDLAIYTTKTYTSEKKEVKIEIEDTWYVYNAADQSIPYSAFSYVGLVEGGATVAESEVTIHNNVQSQVGSYVVSAEITGSDYYTGTGAGLLTITHKDAEVVITSQATMTYGDAVPAVTFDHTESGAAGSDTLITGGASVAYIYSTTDTGVYSLVNGNWTENENYHISYVNDATITSNKRDVTIVTGSLADTEHGDITNVIGGTFEHIGDRMFGEENQIMDYQVDSFVSGDTLADLILTNVFADYTRTIASDANRKYDDRNAQVDASIDDTLYNVTPGSITSDNYNVIFDIGVQNIYQRPFSLEIEDYIPVFYGEDAIQAMKDATEVLPYNGIGGLAEKLDHTIDDLDLIYTCLEGDWSTTAADGTVYNFSVVNGNKNYWMEQPDQATITITYEKLVAYVYNESGTGFTTILYKHVVNDDYTISKIPTHLPVTLRYTIVYAGTDVVVAEGKTEKQSTVGVYRASYNITELTGDFEIILSAEGYVIVK